MFKIKRASIFFITACGTVASLGGCNSKNFREITTGQSFDIHPAIKMNYVSTAGGQNSDDRHITIDVAAQIGCLIANSRNADVDPDSADVDPGKENIGTSKAATPEPPSKQTVAQSKDKSGTSLATCGDSISNGSNLQIMLMEFERAPLDESQRQRYRNAIIGSVLTASERNCGVYLSNLRGYQVTQQSVLSIFEIAVDAAGAIATDAGSSRLLSGLSGVSTSISSEIDSKVFASTAVDLTTAAIEQSMLTSRNNIQSNFTKPYYEWPLSIALADLERMHQSCDMRTGLASIRTSGTAGTADSSAQVQLRQTAATNTARLLFKDLQLLNFQKTALASESETLLARAQTADVKKQTVEAAELRKNAALKQKEAEKIGLVISQKVVDLKIHAARSSLSLSSLGINLDDTTTENTAETDAETDQQTEESESLAGES